MRSNVILICESVMMVKCLVFVEELAQTMIYYCVCKKDNDEMKLTELQQCMNVTRAIPKLFTVLNCKA